MSRLPHGGVGLDRGRPLSFTFDGRKLGGFAGDTLASALIANDVQIVARSFKYHRPRGIFGFGYDEPNALVRIGAGPAAEPNVRAGDVELTDGLAAFGQNAWPSVEFDVGEAGDLLSPFLPAGFYYKTFIGQKTWRQVEPLIRHAAGIGRAPDGTDPATYRKRHAHCDLLIVGAGPAGLAAARVAAASGLRVILADHRPWIGGSLGWCGAEIDGAPAGDFIAATEGRLTADPNVTLLTRATVFGAYDHGAYGLLRQGQDGDAVRQTVWQIRARLCLLATGAIERGLPFADNDRPGVMLSGAVRGYLNRQAAVFGRQAVVVANNDAGYACARDLIAAGVSVAAVIDSRREAEVPAAWAIRELGAVVLGGHVARRSLGRRAVRAIEVEALEGGGRRTIPCDLIAVAGGWSPAVHLYRMAGGALRWDEDRLGLLPAGPLPALSCIGAAAGAAGLAEALADGDRAGRAAVANLGGRADDALTPPQADPRRETRPRAQWHSIGGGRVFVDLASDVTEKDVRLAARENYVSVEHLKRYTTLGMSADQGKTSNLPGLALLAEETGRTIPEVGTTTFRPPFVPVAFGAVAAEARGELLTPWRRLPAHDDHVAANALFEDFGVWRRPAAYLRHGEDLEAAAAREARACRNGVVLFDASPLGKIEVFGPDAETFLQRLYVNEVRTLKPGRVRYGLMLDENGAIIDDGVFSRLAADRFLLSPSSGATPRIAQWVEAWRQGEWPELAVRSANVTGAWACLAVAGPKARAVLARLDSDIDLNPAGFPHMAIREGHVLGIPARVSRVSFTGETQYEIAVPARQASALWRALMKAGDNDMITPIGVEAWLALRIDKGYIHVGSDTDGTTLPGDVGFGAGVAKKRDDFIGRRSLSRASAVRPDREQLIGLIATDRRTVLPVGAQILSAVGVALPAPAHGRVTSSCFSEALGHGVALARLRGGQARIGQTVELYHLGQRLTATVTALPFLDPAGARLHG